jgi:uncharacterized membrane protein YhiD involved in acid resistance
MSPETLRIIIELIAAAALVLGPGAIIVERVIRDRGYGARTIQFCAVVTLIPTIVILSLERIIEAATVGTLIGALTGYLLSGVGDYSPDKPNKTREQNKQTDTENDSTP